MYAGFPNDLVELIRCNKDGGSLISNSSEAHILEGTMKCVSCASEFEIRKGILCLLDPSHLEPDMQLELKERDNNAADYDRHFTERYYKEVISTRAAVGSLKGKTVIEYGAGTGRFTEIFAPSASRYIASDMSFASLVYLAQHKEIPVHAGLVWSEAAGLRVSHGAFDAAISFQMIEHMPLSVREKYYAAVFSALRTGGIFVASVYHQDLRRRMKEVPQDGKHPNGIFYHCFTASEFKGEVTQYLRVAFARPIDVTIPLQKRLHLPAFLDGMLSRVCERIPLLKEYGHLVLLRAQKI